MFKKAVAVFHIGVKTQVGGRQHHGNPVFERVPFDGRLPLPGGVIVRTAVQQIEHRPLVARFLRSGADAVFLLRQDDIHRALHVEHFGIKVRLNQSHKGFPPIQMFQFLL